MTRKKITAKLIAAPPPQEVLKFWTRYVSEWLSHENPAWDIFLNKLSTSHHLSWLCEPGLGDPRFQHGTVYALLEFWADEHRNQEEARWPEHLRASPSRRKRGRPEEFPAPRRLQAFLLLVHQVFTRKGPPPARYRIYAANVLHHFFPSLIPHAVDPKETKSEMKSVRERQRGRALIYQRKYPGDADALARHIVNDAMDIVASCPDLSS